MSADNTCTVTLCWHFKAAPAAVFNAWLDPQQAGKFLFATATGVMRKVEIDARVGGQFCIIENRDGVDAEHVGEYLDIDCPYRLRFSFGGKPFPATFVTLTIQAKATGCELTLVHEGVWQSYQESVQHGWAGILQGLETLLDTAD